MRILPFLLLAACGAADDAWWLTADRASGETTTACLGQPVHDIHGYARVWTGDPSVLELSGETYTGTEYSFAMARAWDNGRRIDAALDLELEGGVLKGDWRYDETDVSDVTCATTAPVELRPITKIRGTWQLTGNLSNATPEPDDCRGDFGESAYTLLLEVYDLGDDRVGAYLNGDPVQMTPRYLGGTADGRALDLSWGGEFDTGSVNALRFTLDGDTASLAWDQEGCVLTMPMTAEAR
ncbi:MAG: hypothetical protein KC912_09210 [Proteobacteria bacterium]|nr:hypothetical protein [Pseudomonadota bacterium]